MELASIPPLARRASHISATLVAHLERLIVTGQLEPGVRLPSERDLAAELSVSRGSLREAMQELENKRLVERRPGRGTVVLPPSNEQLELRRLATDPTEQHNAIELRQLVEPSIAALAATRATAGSLIQLHETLSDAHKDVGARRSLELDLEFHRLLAYAAQNPLLSTLHSVIDEWTLEVRRRSHSTKHGRRRSIDGHWEIYEAVAAHDAEAAREAMRRHLSDIGHVIAARRE